MSNSLILTSNNKKYELKTIIYSKIALTSLERECLTGDQVALAHMNLGAMLHYNGKLREAELSYLNALRLQPNDDVTRANLEKLRSRLRRQ